MDCNPSIIPPDSPILVTGATGFIGPALVESLMVHGFQNIRALVRPSSDTSRLTAVARRYRDRGRVDVIKGNLLSQEDCLAATKDVAVILHLATGGDKSFPDAFLNSVVTTRNLLDAALHHACLRRFVNVSSFAVYSNTDPGPLDETSSIDRNAGQSGDAYRFAKVKQDELVEEYGQRRGLPYVIVRPGSVYGPGKTSITGRVGIDTFGYFLHLGGSNRIPLTYIDNCADAIVLAGVRAGIHQEVFNVVDDALPSSRQFLRLYKRHVAAFRSIYVPHFLSYTLCWLWEKYSNWSEGQLPPVFSRCRWYADWKKTRYSNAKLKTQLGWTPRVTTTEGLRLYFEACRSALHA